MRSIENIQESGFVTKISSDRLSVVPFFPAWIILTAFALTACGEEEKDRLAQQLTVDGLSAPLFALVSEPDARCSALVEYVNRFSEQFAKNSYANARCDAESEKKQKLSFEIREKADATAIGTLIVYLKEGGSEFLLCQDDKSETGPFPADASFCSYLTSDERVSGLPKAFRRETLRVQDFVYSFARYVHEDIAE